LLAFLLLLLDVVVLSIAGAPCRNEGPVEGYLRGGVTTQRGEGELLSETSKRTSVQRVIRKMNTQYKEDFRGE